MQSHNLDYKIVGDALQMVEVSLDANETVIAEAGVMNWMDDGISFEAKLGDGSGDAGVVDKLFSAGKRLLARESLFLTHFTNQSSKSKKVSFAAPYPGKIIPIDLSQVQGDIFCQKDSFLCAAKGVQIDIAFTKNFGTGFFGGEGFILERLSGDGLVCLHAGGTVVERTLQGGESVYLDTGCLVGFTSGIDYKIKKAGNLKSMLFGGEGLFLAHLSGVGKVYIQSLPFSRLADRVISHAPSMGGKSQGEGSVLGRFFNLFE